MRGFISQLSYGRVTRLFENAVEVGRGVGI